MLVSAEHLHTLRTLYERLPVDGMSVPVITLEYEYEAYLRLGRSERAQLLRDWLAGKR